MCGCACAIIEGNECICSTLPRVYYIGIVPFRVLRCWWGERGNKASRERSRVTKPPPIRGLLSSFGNLTLFKHRILYTQHTRQRQPYIFCNNWAIHHERLRSWKGKMCKVLYSQIQNSQYLTLFYLYFSFTAVWICFGCNKPLCKVHAFCVQRVAYSSFI
jgi:hypothetical protein